MRRLGTCLFVFALLGVARCTPQVPVPGDELVGAFQMEARVLESGCVNTLATEDLPADGGFAFEGILSRETGTGQAYLTLNGISRDGGFEGQVFTTTYSAPRQFRWKAGDAGVPCEVNDFEISETLQVVILSASQEQKVLVGGRCPENPSPLLEPGGVPVDPDAGIFAPEARPEGFDAQRVCGFLVDVITPAAACEMAPCTVVYGIEGVRRQ
ncbi:MAG: hypothetical protein WBV82_14415 [Myxococcaceae bacterium]